MLDNDAFLRGRGRKPRMIEQLETNALDQKQWRKLVVTYMLMVSTEGFLK